MAAEHHSKLVPDGLRLGRIFGLSIFLNVPDLLVMIAMQSVLLGLWTLGDPGSMPYQPHLEAGGRLGDFLNYAVYWDRLNVTWEVVAWVIVTMPGIILIHELGHAVAGRLCGLRVRHILIGGQSGHAMYHGTMGGPLRALIAVLAGPLVTAAIAAGIALHLLDAGYAIDPERGAYLLFVMIFALRGSLGNLIPAFPMDGALAFTAVLKLSGMDPVTATRTVSLLGRAVLVVLWAVVPALFFTGAPFFLCAVLVDTLIGIMANEERDQQAEASAVIEELRVADVMSAPSRVRPGSPAPDVLRGAAARRGLPGGGKPIVVIDDNGIVFGFLPTRHLTDLATEKNVDWARYTAADLALPASQLPTVAPDDPLELAITYMWEYQVEELLVMDGWQAAGCVRMAEIDAAVTEGRLAA